MNHSDLVPKYLHGHGTEIGAFKTPIPGIKPIYVDRFAEYANERTLAEYYGDACDLPFHESSLDYVATSHVLEHVANPYRALWEWVRVLRHKGIIYMVVPHRQATFDRQRPLTTVEHMIADFHANVTQCDGTHIDDFVYGVDWQTFSPGTSAGETPEAQRKLAEAYRHATSHNSEINIHFHTFEPATLRSLVDEGNKRALWPARIETLTVIENFPSDNPNGILLVGKVLKPLSARVRTLLAPKGLKSGAKKFN